MMFKLIDKDNNTKELNAMQLYDYVTARHSHEESHIVWRELALYNTALIRVNKGFTKIVKVSQNEQ